MIMFKHRSLVHHFAKQFVPTTSPWKHGNFTTRAGCRQDAWARCKPRGDHGQWRVQWENEWRLHLVTACKRWMVVNYIWWIIWWWIICDLWELKLTTDVSKRILAELRHNFQWSSFAVDRPNINLCTHWAGRTAVPACCSAVQIGLPNGQGIMVSSMVSLMLSCSSVCSQLSL